MASNQYPSHDFTLVFALPDPNEDPAGRLDALYAAGCRDALIGIGRRGSVALAFARHAHSCDEAIRSALNDVRRALPDARLIAGAADA